MSGEALRTVTPIARVSSGRRGSASETRFCTSTCASLMSVPSAKLIVIVSDPSPIDEEDM